MDIALLIIAVLNTLAILLMIFIERKKPEIIVSWILLFVFLPLVGFILYVLIGSGLSYKTRKMLKNKKFYNDNYQNYYKSLVDDEILIENKKISKLIKFNIINAQIVPTFKNKIDFFNDGKSTLDALLEDLKKAKKSINIEYYIFGDDYVGKAVMEILCEKAKQGVKVKLIYDSVGSLRTQRSFFRKLKKAGGEVKEFFPPLFYIRLINLKMNYRNHRKIVVVDGKIGYIGGVNLRKDHMGDKKKLSPWRDAHIRIQGQAVYSLQNAFLNFWQFCNKQDKNTNQFVKEGYFPRIKSVGNSIAQVISSGPDNKKNYIKESMIKMINTAEKEIVIQTPYFVPDDIFISALKTAISSGVKVKIMLPAKPDKKFVYKASLYYAKEMLDAGAEIYLFDGFVHAKNLIIDDYAICTGTANMDNRSFALNFEISTILYDKSLIEKILKVIDIDFKHSKKMTIQSFNKRHFYDKFEQLIFRLFSPLM